ncbi:MAG: VCBS repeat-containing protein [Planctomycetota bacterium]
MEHTNLGKSIWGAGKVLALVVMFGVCAGSSCPGGGGGGGCPNPCDTNADCDATNMEACIDGCCTEVECLADTDCDNDTFCDGDETCTTEFACTNGTDPCDADEECDETDDECFTPCTTNDECTNGIFCDGAEVCTNGACQDGTAPCATGTTCNETTDTCDPITPPTFAVTITGCPTADTVAGTVLSFTADTDNETTGQLLWFEWDVATATTNGAATATLTATTTVTVSVTAYDYVDVDSNGAWTTGEQTDTATADCVVNVPFTAELLVDAGGLNPDRATAAAYLTLNPGDLGAFNWLNGNANQAGVDPSAIATAWTVDSQPTGSGAIAFGNGTEVDSGYTIAPPASRGLYVFRLTATNETTNEEAFDTVTLDLLAEPTVVVEEDFIPTRLHLVRGSAGRDVDLTYTSDSAGFITIFDGTGNSDTLDIVATLTTVDTDGANSNGTVAIPATGDRQTRAPDFYYLETQITDVVGVTPGGGSAGAAPLTDPTNTAEVDEQDLVLYTSVPWTTAATAAGGGVPALIELTTEVGEVAGAGTAAGDVAHSGIGDGTPALVLRSADSVVVGVDFNGDTFNDMAVLRNAGAVDVFFGRVGMNTDYLAAGSGDDWPAQPVGDNDQGEEVTANVALTTSLAAGDVNGDGNPDLVIVQGSAGADQIQIILGQGASTVTPFTNAATAGRFRLYPATTIATDFNDATAAVGDVTGDGIADIIIGAPNYFAPGGGVGDGAIFIIYGSAGLAASLTNIETVAAAPTGRSLFGTAGGGLRRGEVIAIGDFNGAGALDLVAAFGNQVASGIEIFIGTGIFPGAPTTVYNLVAVDDMVGGSLALADVDGVAGVDVLVGAANAPAAAGDGLFTIIPNGTADNTALNSAATIDYAAGAASGEGLGTAVNVFDYNGDGNLDVLIGAVGPAPSSYVDVKYGPITGDFTVTGVNVRLSWLGGTTADQVLIGDINADGNPDLIMTDDANNDAYCLFGLD